MLMNYGKPLNSGLMAGPMPAKTVAQQTPVRRGPPMAAQPVIGSQPPADFMPNPTAKPARAPTANLFTAMMLNKPSAPKEMPQMQDDWQRPPEALGRPLFGGGDYANPLMVQGLQKYMSRYGDNMGFHNWWMDIGNNRYGR